MSLVKIAFLESIGTRLANGAESLGLKSLGQTIAKNKSLAAGIALTGGIGAADAVTEGTFAPKGQKVKATLTGLKKGLLYGGVLSAAEHGITKGIDKFKPLNPRMRVPA